MSVCPNNECEICLQFKFEDLYKVLCNIGGIDLISRVVIHYFRFAGLPASLCSAALYLYELKRPFPRWRAVIDSGLQ